MSDALFGKRVHAHLAGYGYHEGVVSGVDDTDNGRIIIAWDDGDMKSYTVSKVEKMLAAMSKTSPSKKSKKAKSVAATPSPSLASPAPAKRARDARSPRADAAVRTRSPRAARSPATAELDAMDVGKKVEETAAPDKGRSRRSRKPVNYAKYDVDVSDDEDDEEQVQSDGAADSDEADDFEAKSVNARGRKARKKAASDSEDEVIESGKAKCKGTAAATVATSKRTKKATPALPMADAETQPETEMEAEPTSEAEAGAETGAEAGAGGCHVAAVHDAEAKAAAAARAKANAAVVRKLKAAASWKQKHKLKWTEEQIDELPVMIEPYAMFDDIVRRAEEQATKPGAALEGKSLSGLAKQLAGRPVRVATMCSGTESPLLALDMICQALQAQQGVALKVEHVFSCEIEPFKQAYIERNFAPPILFRDIRELGDDEATTAYGSLKRVPGDVDILIAGTSPLESGCGEAFWHLSSLRPSCLGNKCSCVDYSNLNNKQQTIEQKGESGQTFWGMLGWVRRHRPPIVLQENVCGAPWEAMVDYYAKEGYAAHFLRVDTKSHYIPHTRTRVYLLAIDARADKHSARPGASGRADELSKWDAAINELSRPSSSSLEAFLLPTDDPRVHRAREDLARPKEKFRTAVTDWGRCETRHQYARDNESLGPKRPLTMWESAGHCSGPDFAWHDWYKAQVERVLDLMDINFLRLAQKNVDANFKTLVWNLSQNVDRTTGSVRPGLCPCLTPNMVPYVTNRGGPLIGPEVLSLQGIPVDDLLLTRESEEQMADLAGNAMTSTIVGTCILAALVLGQDYLTAFKGTASLRGVGLITSTGDSAVDTDAYADAQSDALSESPLQLAPSDGHDPRAQLRTLIADAARSARMCISEGRLGTADEIRECSVCGGTVSRACSLAWPEHVQMKPMAVSRLQPAEFEARLKAALPMCVFFEGLDVAERMRPDGTLLCAQTAAKRGLGKKSKVATDEPEAAPLAPNAKASKGKAGAPQKTLMDGWLKKPKPKARAEEEEEDNDVVAPTGKRASRQPPGVSATADAEGGRASELSDEAMWRAWLCAVDGLARHRFYFRSIRRGEAWTATYASHHGRLELVIQKGKAEWLLYATCPDQRGPLRDLLLQPVARMHVRASGAGAALLSGDWEICLPKCDVVPVKITPLGEPIESWQASLGLLNEWEGSTRYGRWHVDVATSDAARFDVDVRGEYELLPKCGGALGSLHKRARSADGSCAAPLYLFIDPSRTGEGEADHAVFASDFSRIEYNETRRLVGEVEASWRPWSKRGSARRATETVECLVRGMWAAASGMRVVAVSFDGAVVSTPTRAPSLKMDADTRTPPPMVVLQCQVPLCEAEMGAWPRDKLAPIVLTRSKRTFEAISFITERLSLPEALQEWTSLDAAEALAKWIGGESPCEQCAPSMPLLQWVRAGKGKLVAVEDPVQAGAYEQRLKRRPAAFVVRRRAIGDDKGERVAGELQISANPLALAMRALASLPPSGLASRTSLTWRVVAHDSERKPLRPLRLSSNKADEAAPQPPHFGAFAGRDKRKPVRFLRVEQQRSLTWMLSQEADDAPVFNVEEVAEGVLAPLGWRLEARARMPTLVRGGVLADEVGYGKTVITVALIDSTSREAVAPPPPLAPTHYVPLGATLVLAPSHLIKQWPTEVDKFTGGALKVKVVATMADLNKLTVRELQKVDIVVCSITLLRNDLYYSRLTNLAGADALPSKASARHFGQAYGAAVRSLGEQVERLAAGDVSAAREAVKQGQRRRAEARALGKGIGQTLGTTDKRLGALAQGKKATYAAEKKLGKAAAEVEEDGDGADDGDDAETAPVPKRAKNAKGQKAVPKAGKRAKVPSDYELDESEAGESDDDDDDDDDDDASEEEELKPKRKRAAGAARKAPSVSEKEEVDPWGLNSAQVSSDWRKLQAAPFESFYWRRLVVDEYTYNKERDHIAIVSGIRAHARWVLSGTPDVSGFAAVAETAKWLNVHLGSADSSELTKQERKEQSALERFQFFKEVHTPAWHAARHELAQSFLNRYVRQNIAEIDEIPWREQAAMVTLPPAERALYVELKNHLEALDMKNNHKTIKSKCKSENDREARLAQVLGGAESPDEALLKRCSHFDMLGSAKNATQACDTIVKTRRHQLQLCKDEIVRQARFCVEHDGAWTFRRDSMLTSYARAVIDLFEKKHPIAKLDAKQQELRKMPRDHFNSWRLDEVKECGDAEAEQSLLPLIAQGLAKAYDGKVGLPDNEKQFKDKMAWVRDQVHLLRRLQKEMTGRVRSLRFFEKVRELQICGEQPLSELRDVNHAKSKPSASPKRSSPAKQSPKRASPSKPADVDSGVLSCCGHTGKLSLLRESAERQECPVAGCRAAVRTGCIVPMRDLGREVATGANGSSFGAKLSCVLKLIKRIPEGERILIFVQFVDLLMKVQEALSAAGIKTALLQGSPNKRSATIEQFQTAELQKGHPRVLLLNLRDESAAGANLTAANHCIFLHPLLVGTQQEFDSCDTQAVGRVRRYGQRNVVQIYRFVVDNTIDVDIFRARRADASDFIGNATPADAVQPAD